MQNILRAYKHKVGDYHPNLKSGERERLSLCSFLFFNKYVNVHEEKSAIFGHYHTLCI